MWEILQDNFKLWKCVLTWVPYDLMPVQQQYHMVAQHIQAILQAEDPHVIITDETWILQYNQDTKKALMQWLEPTECHAKRLGQ